MPRKAKNIPANESKSQKFARLANQRVNRIILTYKQLGALGGSAYESTSEQVKKIGDALKASHDRAMDQLQKKAVSTDAFKL